MGKIKQLFMDIEEKKGEMMEIIQNKDWGQVQELYKEMEENRLGSYVPEISELMTDEDVVEYKKWDKEINGSTETQMI